LNPIMLGITAFVFSLVGIAIGLLLRSRLPDHHLSADSKDAVKMGSALLATFTALVLGLLVSSAKSTFDSMSDMITKSGTNVILLDHALAQYGPETDEMRQTLRKGLTGIISGIWPKDGHNEAAMAAFESGPSGTELLQAKLRQLTPMDDSQKASLVRALELSGTLVQLRWLAIEQSQNSMPTMFIIVLLFWLTVFFITTGLFAPPNGTVIAVLLVCALSVGAAMYLIGEMNHPLQGTMKVSPAPLVKALEHIGKS
jgi:hypothetical protein